MPSIIVQNVLTIFHSNIMEVLIILLVWQFRIIPTVWLMMILIMNVCIVVKELI